MTDDVDADLLALDRDALISEARRLRAGIRDHRDQSLHGLCWHHPDLWELLPERVAPEIQVPEWPQFLRGCIHYRESLDRQAPGAPRVAQDYKGN